MKNVLSAFVLFIIFSICVSAQSSADSDNYLQTLTNAAPLFDTTQTASKATVVYDAENAWKEWKTVENFSFGKDRGDLPMIADLQSLHPYFRDKIFDLIRNCRAMGIEVAIVESYRTRAKQGEYFGMGRKYTRSKGGKSKHQYGLAVDIVPIVDSVAVWDNVTLWKQIGVAGEKLGLRWGGRWRTPYDPAHFEWTGGTTTFQLATGQYPLIPRAKADQYPCIEDDVKQLQKYWEAWENEQRANANAFKQSPVASSQKP
ncbi:MAG: M15 family metallopeptidase [Bacteroidota bacterium]